MDGATERLSALPTATSAMELDVSNRTDIHHSDTTTTTTTKPNGFQRACCAAVLAAALSLSLTHSAIGPTCEPYYHLSFISLITQSTAQTSFILRLPLLLPSSLISVVVNISGQQLVHVHVKTSLVSCSRCCSNQIVYSRKASFGLYIFSVKLVVVRFI